jgi:hypothetical protein
MCSFNSLVSHRYTDTPLPRYSLSLPRYTDTTFPPRPLFPVSKIFLPLPHFSLLLLLTSPESRLWTLL